MLPSWLTPATIAVAVATAVGSSELATGVAPAALAAGIVLADYAAWRRRGRRWHDAAVIIGLLPALACSVWIGIGGLATGVERTNAERLLFEVGPGIALTGLVCTLVSYHGRHHPGEPPQRGSSTGRGTALRSRLRALRPAR